MKVLIVEDEKIAAEKLARLLGEINPEINVEAIFESISQTTSWLKEHTVDLIFLDIYLSDGNCFRIFDELEVKTPIIFVTAYDQYAIQAFKVNSIDYLLKPINKYDLIQSLEKFDQIHSVCETNKPIDYSNLIESIKTHHKLYQKRFMVVVGDQIKTVPCEEVAYFFAEGKYVFLVHKNKERYLVDFTLDKLVELLDPDRFFRVNRQVIVGFESIQSMQKWFTRRIKLHLLPESDNEVIVSVERLSDFKKWLNR
ncbi:MAG: LytTR family DNA-binding domain-containing protein [Prolixibacteraceae bacterium]|jgi:two-component system response regulator LytT|nr:LytTR family DNA-binding domain-containing protein [Prolixibacteraceae bacterium]